MAEAEKEQPAREAVAVTITDIELESLRREAKDYKEKYLLTLAESENLRKRLQKERQELIQYAIQNLVVDVLHPLDHLENALSHTDNVSDEVKHWAQGFQMILTQFKEALANHGVKPFQSEGEQFDPHIHEAIEMVITNDYKPGTVVAESLKGYKIGDRTIRPARVKVAKEETQSEEKEKNNE